ncbi:MFS transporter [Streptomyces sp. NPDC049916]|uniref:MFS transporter n=1 Tax=Streptomyces sp. NPDC049916 TaxID=3155156 RepID=UPI00343EEE2C
MLPAAASLATVTVNGARAVGPAIAGIIVAAGGPGFVFALNAASFPAVAIALLAWKRPPQRRGSQERVLAGLAAGLRYVRSAPSVRRILWRSLIFTFPASALSALLPSAASSLMNAGAGGCSLLLALLGVGAVAGVVVMPKARELLSGSALLAVASILFGAGTAGAALLPLWGPQSRPWSRGSAGSCH